MKRTLKKTLAFTVSSAVIASMLTLPAISVSADTGDAWKFDFGATAPTDSSWTQVTADMAYSDSVGYGFLGQSDETYDLPAVVDGYTQTAENKTRLQNGGTGSDVYSDYVYTDDVNMPIRFAKKVENNTYYKIKVTMGASDKDSKIYLTSERRHFVLMDETITAGDKLTKEFTVAVHNVKWKNRGGNPAEPIYADDMINVCVLGENPMLNAIEIEQIDKPKVVWAFGDSTVTDGGSGLPYFGYNTYAGWAISIAKYLPDDVAVVNLGEGGLSTVNTAYFDVGKVDITEGDIVAFQMGHNDSSTESYLKNLDYYYNATVEKGGTFVLCSPIERLSQYSTVEYHNAAQQYAESKNTPFVPLHTLTKNMYDELGNVKKWYTHTCLWEGSAASPKATQDASHLNDFGADRTSQFFFQSLAELASKYSVLAPYVTAQADRQPMALSEEIMKGGTSNYVTPPNNLYPFPESSIDYPMTVDITSAKTAVIDGVKYMQSYKTVRHSDLSYITGFAATYNSDGSLAAVVQNRLEPMSAKTVETVSLINDEKPNGLAIPEGGSYKTFVWGGAFSDNSMSYEPYSAVFSGYNYLSEHLETANWAGTGAADNNGTVTISANGGYKAITTPVTSGKIITQFNIQPQSGTTNIVLSPNDDGSTENGITLALNSSTGAVSINNNIVIDSVKSGKAYDIVLIYDIDYGILTINVDGVGIVNVEIPDAISMSGINPDQIGSVAFTGSSADAIINNFKISTLKTAPLPEKTIAINYDTTRGTVEAPASAVKNSIVTLKAIPDKTEVNNVFGGWINPDGTVLSKDEELSFYLVDDITLTAKFYEQLGLAGVSDYTIEADKNIVKVPETGTEEIALDIKNCVDNSGNPVADFDHSSSVTWALKNTIDGISINGNKIIISSEADIAQEDMVNLTVEAKCNDVVKTGVIVVNNCTNIVYNENFETGTAGDTVTGWSSWVADRYKPLYNTENDNTYLDMQPIGSTNGTTLIGKLIDNSITGVVQVKADVLMKQPTGTEYNREMAIGFADDSGNNKTTVGKYAVKLVRNQSSNNYVINGITLEEHPSDDEWATVTAVMNYNTKTADIKLTSLDGTKTYFDRTSVPFANSDAANFRDIVYETNRYNGAAKIDNIIINHIAGSESFNGFSVNPESVEISDVSKISTIAVTLPDKWEISSVASSDNTIITVAVDNGAISVTPVKEGDAAVTIVAQSNLNRYIKAQSVVPVSVKTPTNANLSGLSLTTNEGSELIDTFNIETTAYEAKMAGSVSSITVTPVTDSSASSYAVKYNGSEVDGNTVNINAEADEQIISVVVTAGDGTTTKEYSVEIDNSYLIAENFAKVSNDWGFTGSGGVSAHDGLLEIVTKGDAKNQRAIEKTMEEEVSDAKKVTVSFEWKSLIESGKGRNSYFTLQDSSGASILGLYGDGAKGIDFFTNSVDSRTNLENFTQNWYSISLTLDFEAQKMSGTITNSSGNVVKTFTDEPIAASNLGKLYAINTYSVATMAIDNFYVKSIVE